MEKLSVFTGQVAGAVGCCDGLYTRHRKSREEQLRGIIS